MTNLDANENFDGIYGTDTQNNSNKKIIGITLQYG